jgi:hypothetical protein
MRAMRVELATAPVFSSCLWLSWPVRLGYLSRSILLVRVVSKATALYVAMASVRLAMGVAEIGTGWVE